MLNTITRAMIALSMIAIAAQGLAAPVIVIPGIPTSPGGSRAVAGRRHYEVYPGSAFKLVQMLDRTQWSYVAGHADAFYHHPVGFRELTEVQQKQLTGEFTTRRAIAEGDFKSGIITGDVKNLQTMLSMGMKPTEAVVNEVGPDPEMWRQRIAANAALGASTLLMLAPHVVYRTGWNDPALDYARTLIKMPGCTGSAVDAPTYLFLHRGAKYAQSIYDQRNYTAAQGKNFMFVLSPNDSNALFLQDSEQVIRALEDNDAEPDSYAVELYGKRPIELTPESVPGTGKERPAASTILGVAYYLLKHRDGEPGTLTLSASKPSRETTQVTLANTSTWLDYAPVVKATVVGRSSGWGVRFLLGTQDITRDIMGGGFLFYKEQRLLPGTHQQIDVRLDAPRLAGKSTRPPTVTLQALPHAGSIPLSTLTLDALRL